jgi:hypothetical protein
MDVIMPHAEISREQFEMINHIVMGMQWTDSGLHAII